MKRETIREGQSTDRKTMAKPKQSSNTSSKGWGDVEYLDFENRDPNNLHTTLKISFEDAIGEPDETTFSFNCVWKYSYLIFFRSKFCCYKFLSVVCAIPTALGWGLCYASFAYFSIWWLRPCAQLSGLQQCFECCCSAIKTTSEGVAALTSLRNTNA